MIYVEKQGLLALANRLRGKLILGALEFDEIKLGEANCLVVGYIEETVDEDGHDREHVGRLLVVGGSVVELS